MTDNVTDDATDEACGISVTTNAIYDLPLVQKYFNRWSWTSTFPFCPTFRGFGSCCRCRRKADNHDEEGETVNMGYANGIERSDSREQEATKL